MINFSNSQVLGIIGSPRQGGNTEILVDEVLSGAESAGAIVKKVILNKLNINPCQACNSCYKTGKCMHDDDMLELLKKMEESDIWVLGTPIYWWGPTAQFKAFLDRWVSIARSTFQGKKVILAIPMGGGSESYAQHTVAMFEDIFSYLGMNHITTILAPGSDGRDAVRNSPQLVERARRIGKDVTQ